MNAFEDKGNKAIYTYLSLEMAFRKILENFELQKKYKR
jgi:hypothetical protein